MEKMSRKEARVLEQVFKGAANHWRVEILDLLAREPELSVVEISDKTKCKMKNVSEHLRKLTLAGLIMKRYEGNRVRHALTDRGKSILKFCRILE